MRIDIWTVSPFIAIGMAVVLFVQWRRGHSVGYLVCLALFGLYLAAVAEWTVFPIELGLDASDLAALAQGRTIADAVQIVPFHDGLAPTRYELVGNILLGIPFGFGLPFVSNRRGLEVLVDGLFFAVGIELVQLLIDLAYGFGYRVVDVNDVILVWFGAIAGYAAFRLLSAAYRWGIQATSVGMGVGAWSHVHEVLTR